jgi:hypothetical protein
LNLATLQGIWQPACTSAGMTNEFLQALRVQTDGLRTKISHAYHATGNPTPRTTGQAPFPQPNPAKGESFPVPPLDPSQPARLPQTPYGAIDLADLDAHSARLVAMIDAEIKRGPNSQENELRMLDRRPLLGETQQQTEFRLKAQDYDNPLVARTV